jgi:activator of HSP90 ATPase
METSVINQEVEFDVSCREVYELLMDGEKHAAFTGAPCTMSREVGGKYTCYGDYIEGKNLKVVPDKKIVQTWVGKDFPEGAVSKVTFEFVDDGGKCKLIFTHEDVPVDLTEGIEKGWKEHYWDKMKEFLERNS